MLRVLILVQPVSVNDEILSEAEIDMAVQRLKGGRAGGASGMKAGNLKGWIKEAKREKEPEGRRWDLVVRIVQVIFRYGTFPG